MYQNFFTLAVLFPKLKIYRPVWPTYVTDFVKKAKISHLDKSDAFELWN